MILENAKIEIKSNVQNSERAKVNVCATMFNVLSSQIYTDKVAAVIREIVFNAIDAHTASGKSDIPVQVWLPTMFDQNFVVKDFGTGINPDQINDIYLTYFGSNKRDTNELVGGLGLGSKSPLAYTDQFAVVNNWNGKSYTHFVFKNENGEPDISLVSVVDTDEPNGLTVQISVRDSDVSSFTTKAANIFKWMKVKPEIMSGNISIPEIEIDRTVGHFTVNQNLVQNKVSVLMGDIIYRVDEQYYSGIKKDYLNTLGGIIFNFNVGELEFQPSREALSMNRTNIEKIEARVQKFNEDFINSVVKSVEGCENFTEFYRINNGQLFRTYFEHIDQELTLKDGTVVSKEFCSIFNKYRITLDDKFRTEKVMGQIAKRSFTVINNYLCVKPDSDLLIIHHDLPKYETLIRNFTVNRKYEIYQKYWSEKDSCTVVFETDENIESLKEILSNYFVPFKVVKSSQLVSDGVYVKPASKKSQEKGYSLVIVSKDGVRNCKMTLREIYEMDKEVYFVHGEQMRNILNRTYLYKNTLKGSDKNVILINEKLAEKIKNKGFKSFREFTISDELKGILESNLSVERIKNYYDDLDYRSIRKCMFARKEFHEIFDLEYLCDSIKGYNENVSLNNLFETDQVISMRTSRKVGEEPEQIKKFENAIKEMNSILDCDWEQLYHGTYNDTFFKILKKLKEVSENAEILKKSEKESSEKMEKVA